MSEKGEIYRKSSNVEISKVEPIPLFEEQLRGMKNPMDDYQLQVSELPSRNDGPLNPKPKL